MPWSELVRMSNVIAGRVAAAAHAGGRTRVAALCFCKEFFCVGFVVLPSLDAEFASAVAGFAAV